MVRVKRGNIASKRRKKYLGLAKGFVGANSRLSTMAGEQVVQSFNFAYIGRRLKKRNFRRKSKTNITKICLGKTPIPFEVLFK